MAETVADHLENSGCMELYEQSVSRECLAHGDYNYHNILILPGGTGVTNFEHMCIDIQVHDYIILLEKQWKSFNGKKI